MPRRCWRPGAHRDRSVRARGRAGAPGARPRAVGRARPTAARRSRGDQGALAHVARGDRPRQACARVGAAADRARRPFSPSPSSTPCCRRCAPRRRRCRSRPTGRGIPGPLVAGHQAFAQDCAKCHELPFVRVRDRACLGCHQKIAGHVASAEVEQRLFGATRCATCHADHKGADRHRAARFGPLHRLSRRSEAPRRRTPSSPTRPISRAHIRNSR